MSCGIGSPKQLFRVVTNAEGTLAPYRAPDPRGGRAPFRNTFIPASHQTGGGGLQTLDVLPLGLSKSKAKGNAIPKRKRAPADTAGALSCVQPGERLTWRRQPSWPPYCQPS